MNGLIMAIVGFFAAIIGSMGLGGGGILLLYISAFTDIPQLKAQGINLLFFLPIGLVSLCFHIKNRLVDKKAALLTVVSAVPAAVAGAFLASSVNQDILRKGLAVFLFFLGVRELIGSFKKKDSYRK